MNKIDFYTCWEDINPIQEALNVNTNDVVLTITSGGCNVFNFLLYNPKKVISVDYNPYQKYLMELKIESIRNLDYKDFLEILGVKLSNNKEKHYENIKRYLSKEAREYWDSNKYALNKGILYVGEQNAKIFGKILRFLKGKELLELFFECEPIDEQNNYFNKKIYGFPLKLLSYIGYNKYSTRIMLCFRMLNDYPIKKKRPPEYFKYIQKAYYPYNHRNKLKYIFTKIPIRDNYFASLILLGYYTNENCFPQYLKKESFQKLKERLNKIEIKTDTLENVLNELPDNTVSKFNLSNIFDWSDDDDFKKQLNEIVRVGKHKSRIFYSATRKDRFIPEDIKGLGSDKKFAKQLSNIDRTMLYSSFVVGNISK